ncbi:hypothetical protein B0G77_8544, partial [Paraburkholderia sp. BL10I2N1]
MLARRFRVMETRPSAGVSSSLCLMGDGPIARCRLTLLAYRRGFPVPAPPQLSKPVWLVLLGVVQCLGAALTIFLWPKGRPTNTVWFWFCVVGLSDACMGVFAVLRLGYLYARRSGAIAQIASATTKP